MARPYTSTAWANGTAPAISAANLGKIESQLTDLTNTQTTLNSGLICAPKANLPEYPDNVAGTTYLGRNFIAADGWTATNCTLSYSSGKMIVTATATNPSISRAVTAEKSVRFKFRKLTGNATASRIANSIAVLYGETKTYDDTGFHDFYIGAGATGNLVIYPGFTGSASGDTYEIELIYIGDGTYSSLALDASGNGNHGTVYGCTPVAGITGRALQFDGNDRITVLTGAPQGDITISLWAKIIKGEATLQYILSRTNAGFVEGLLYLDTSDNIIFRSRTSDGSTAVQSLIPVAQWVSDTWMHIVGIQNGLTTSIYLNGVIVDTDTHASIWTSYGTSIGIGASIAALSPLLAGTIDDPRIYNRALSAEEVWELYQNPGAHEITDMVMASTPVPNSVVTRGPSGGLAVRSTTLNPKDATASARPISSMLGEIIYYSGKLYLCTNITTPTWELITSA
jgi:hypothetical protein